MLSPEVARNISYRAIGYYCKICIRFQLHSSICRAAQRKDNKNLLDLNKEFFDNCLQYPLDEQQRRSILSDGYNCLVISSAGSGKTSSIIGKVKYLTTIKGASPERICLISYTNKEATELTERMSTIGIKGYTFHKLATDIIAHETGEKPSICDNTDALFATIYHELSQQSSYKSILSNCYLTMNHHNTILR